MKINWKITTGVFAALFVNQLAGSVVLYLDLKKFEKHDKNCIRLANLYAKELNDNGIRIDPFTKIIMNELLEDMK